MLKDGNRQKLRRGEWPAKAPYGYINDSRTNNIQIDSERSKIIQRAFKMFAEGGRSFTDIALYLHKFGIVKVSRQHIGKPLKVSTIKHILTNKFYLGIMKHNGEYYQGSHKLFISKQLFDSVQKQVSRIGRPRIKGHNFAFRGLARCGECGAVITSETHTKYYKETNRTATYVYYRCTKKLETCNQKYISEDELGQQVRKIIQKAALPQKWANDWYKWLEEDEIKERQLTEENTKRLDVEMRNLDIKINKLLDGYLDGIIDPEIYKLKKNEFFNEKLKITEEITRIKTDGSSWLELLFN